MNKKEWKQFTKACDLYNESVEDRLINKPRNEATEFNRNKKWWQFRKETATSIYTLMRMRIYFVEKTIENFMEWQVGNLDITVHKSDLTR